MENQPRRGRHEFEQHQRHVEKLIQPVVIQEIDRQRAVAEADDQVGRQEGSGQKSELQLAETAGVGRADPRRQKPRSRAADGFSARLERIMTS